MYTDVMLDLETLDTLPSAVVLSAGIVLFDRRNKNVKPIGRCYRFGAKAHREEQIQVGRTTSKDTIQWWKSQSDEAKAVSFNSDTTPKKFLASLTKIIGQLKVRPLVWGNGATFDITITESLYRSYGMSPPWEFWEVRCFRTMKAEHGHIIKPVDFSGEKHNPMHDAMHQVKILCAIYEALQNSNLDFAPKR